MSRRACRDPPVTSSPDPVCRPGDVDVRVVGDRMKFKNRDFRVYRRPENGFTAAMNGWPDRPSWLVDVLAPGIDYYNIAGFPTWREAFDFAHTAARVDWARARRLLSEEDVS